MRFRYPLKVNKSMGPKRIAKRSKVKPFIKVVNYAHLLPTRYALELESLKGSVSAETFKEVSQREDVFARSEGNACTSELAPGPTLETLDWGSRY